ncbi:MAG: bL21 family ribosomal protein, partial [Candidatus Competibacter sp.]|nr:bL21 family ribosomal protein [Candidatus Competibacter sp.]
IRIIKFRRRKHYRKTQGHRQSYTELRIGGITGLSVAPSLEKAETAPIQEG